MPVQKNNVSRKFEFKHARCIAAYWLHSNPVLMFALQPTSGSLKFPHQSADAIIFFVLLYVCGRWKRDIDTDLTEVFHPLINLLHLFPLLFRYCTFLLK